MTVITQEIPPSKGRSRRNVPHVACQVWILSCTVQLIWSKNDLKPQVVRTFKLSDDPDFEETVWDVIGTHPNPPKKDLVLCCDEKSQCQFPERSQAGLRLAPCHPRIQTRDYRRDGMIMRFSALNYLEGTLISPSKQCCTHIGWMCFLKQTDWDTPRSPTLHIIADNYTIHKHAAGHAWLARCLRFVARFSLTGSYWLSLVEKFFADVTCDVIHAGSFASARHLVRDIRAYLAQRNADPKPYKWRAQCAAIPTKIGRACVALNESHGFDEAISESAH